MSSNPVVKSCEGKNILSDLTMLRNQLFLNSGVEKAAVFSGWKLDVEVWDVGRWR